METRPLGAAERRAHRRVGNAVAALRADARGEHGRLDGARCVDGGPARVAVTDQPAERGHLAQRAAGRARRRCCRSRPGPRVERAVLGESRGSPPRRRGCASRSGGGRASGPGRGGRRRPLCGRRRARCAAWPRARMPGAPATTWAAVTTRCGAATQPEPSTPSPQAAAVMRTTHAVRAAHGGGREARCVRRRRRRRRAGDRRERVDARERPQHRSRRHDRVQLLDDPRARAPRRAPSVCPGSCSSTAAATQTSASPSAAPATKPPIESSKPERRDHRAGCRARTSRRSRRPPAAASRRRPRRRGRRAACTASSAPPCRNCGASREPITAPSDEPAERERGRDEAAPVAGERRERRHGERDPVGAGHPRRVIVASAPILEAAGPRGLQAATLAP